MKGNKKILVVAVLLLLIAASYTTYAIYKTTVEGNTSVTAAKWNVSFKDGQTEISEEHDLVLTCAGNAHTKAGVIAPGANCTGTLTIDADDTEVDVAYTVTNGTPKKGNTALSGDENDWTVTLTGGSGTIGYDTGSNTRTATVTVTLAWAGVDDSTAEAPAEADTINDADTLLAGQTITVPLIMTAKQVVGS